MIDFDMKCIHFTRYLYVSYKYFKISFYHFLFLPLDYLKEELALALDERLLQREQLDIDYATAKDDYEKHPVRTFELYKKDRHPAQKPSEYPVQEELGGMWFRGLSETIAKQGAVVQVCNEKYLVEKNIKK